MNNHYVWAAVERIAPQLVTFGVSIVIARLVGPEAYGLVGMLAIFMALGQAFSELGLSAAIIQRKEVSDDDLMSVFVVNVVAGIAMTLIGCAIAPLVAAFYNEPKITGLMSAQSLTFVIASVGAVQAALISREMRFKFNAKVEVFACFVSAIVGLVMAFRGFEVWSLVGLGLSRVFTRVCLLWAFRVWQPAGRFSWQAFNGIWAYSSRLLYASLLHRVVTNLYSVIIGKVYSPADLGLYTRAYSLQQMPVGIIAGIVQRVAFPLFSKNQHDLIYLKATLRKQVRLILALVVSGMALLYAISEELILLLLGEEWLGAVALLKILCIAGVFSSIFPLHSNMTMALGNSKLFFRVEMIKKIYIILALACVYRFGMNAFAWGMVSVSIFDYFASSWPTRKALGYTVITHAEDVLPTLLAGVIPVGLLSLVHWSGGLAPIVVICLKALFIGLFIMIAIVAFRKTWFKDVWEVLDTGLLARLRPSG